MKTPEHLQYTASHEWIEASGESLKVGITDHAQNELSDVVYVELPAVGRKVKAGEAVAVVESVKAASDIYSPVDGEITAVNGPLSSDPALVNQSPYEQGWLFSVKSVDPTSTAKLLDAATYAKTIG